MIKRRRKQNMRSHTLTANTAESFSGEGRWNTELHKPHGRKKDRRRREEATLPDIPRSHGWTTGTPSHRRALEHDVRIVGQRHGR